MPTFADNLIRFFQGLHLDAPPVPGVQVLNPYASPAAMSCVHAFYRQYFNDSRPRASVWGINPGRHGGGLTGVAFTDPVALRTFCGIPNTLGERREVSSEFIYRFIHAFGGPERFYSRFYIGSACPLGFTKDSRNYNFYDDAAALHAVEPFIVETMNRQISFGLQRHAAVCLGTGKLYKVLRSLNDHHGFFERIIPLEHPRFIMQYRRKRMDEYIESYCTAFESLYSSAIKAS